MINFAKQLVSDPSARPSAFWINSSGNDMAVSYTHLDVYKRQDIYCPWDVINFAKKLVSDLSARPSAFWINSSCLLYTSRCV